MQFFFSEFPADYSKYDFPYQIYLRSEYGDDWTRIYASGFLPTRHKRNVFYLCRSTRVKLSNFSLTSENRRILAKLEGISLQISPMESFQYELSVQRFCAQSTRKTGNSKPIFTTANIKAIFTGKTNITHIATYKDAELNVLGYAALVVNGTLCHYAYPFPSPVSDNHNLNIGMMTQVVDWAYNQHKQFIYLGTCYTPGSLYKMQFNNFEFFTGWNWSNDLSQLKDRISRSGHHLFSDQEFLSKYYPDEENFNTDSVIRTKFK